MKEVKTINYIQFEKIDTIEDSNSILFSITDVLRVLEYEDPDKVLANLCNSVTLIRLVTNLKKEQKFRTQAEKQNTENYPKVLFATSVEASRCSILIGELAKILRQNGVKMGQNRLFQWLREHHYLGKSGERYNCPTQRAMDMGLFEIKKTTICKPDGTILVASTPKITGKGQIYFMNKFMNVC